MKPKPAKLLPEKDHVKRYTGVREGQPVVDTKKYDKDAERRRQNGDR